MVAGPAKSSHIRVIRAIGAIRGGFLSSLSPAFVDALTQFLRRVVVQRQYLLRRFLTRELAARLDGGLAFLHLLEQALSRIHIEDAAALVSDVHRRSVREDCLLELVLRV